MITKHCPNCTNTITINELKQSGHYDNFIKRKSFLCPHCQTTLTLPPAAETLLTTGLLFSVIVAPLLYYWIGQSLWIYFSFLLGVGLIIFGAIKNQLQVVNENKQ